MTERKGWKEFYTKTFPWFPFDKKLKVLKQFVPMEITLQPSGMTVYGITTEELGTLLVFKKQMTEIADRMLYDNLALREEPIDVYATKTKNADGKTVMILE